MAYGRRDGFSYADDIPIKISERVRVPPRVTLPLSFQPSISLDLLEEYDFSLENQVLEFGAARKKAKEAKEKERAQNVAREIEKFTQSSGLPKLESGTATNNKCPQGGQDDFKEEDDNQVPKSWKPTQILSPEPLVNKGKSILSDNTPNDRKKINLEDFESQSGSPFDFVELQTINEIEELSNVFRGIVSSKTLEDKSISKAEYSIIEEPRLEYPVQDNRDLTSISSSSYNRHHIAMEDVIQVPISPPKAYVSNEHPQNYHTLIENETRDPVYSVNPSQNYFQYIQPDTSTMASGSNYPLTNGPHYSQSNMCSGAEGYSELPRLRGSKSTSDISIERDDTVAARAKASLSWRSQTPPPTTIGQLKNASMIETPKGYLFTNAAANYNSEGRPSFKESLARTQPKQIDYLPDPFDELDNDQKHFVSSLVDMGFPRDRAARAVKHLGMDDKKVVDHLCQVQGLIENGCDGLDSETALHLYDYNIDEARKFLDLLAQFQDLGFSKDSSRKALIRHKNDRDKALDSLLS